MEHSSKIQSNLKKLKSLTKKLDYLAHIKWHRRCKSLTFQQKNISRLYFFSDFHEKKFRVGTFS